MFKLLVTVFRSLLLPRSGLLLENLALRHQLAVLKRSSKRPRLRGFDHIFWVWLSQLWPNWRSSLVIVKPGTVIRWHHQDFKLSYGSKTQPNTSSGPSVL